MATNPETDTRIPVSDLNQAQAGGLTKYAVPRIPVDAENSAYHSHVMAQVTYEREAAKQLAELPNVVLARMEGIVSRLQNWPAVSGAKPLRGGLAGHYRIRTGDYRIQFRVVQDEVIIERIGHRDGFYED